MLRLIASVALSAASLLLALSYHPPAIAQDTDDPLTVIAVDLGAAGDSLDREMAETAMRTVAGAMERGKLVLVDYGITPYDFTLPVDVQDSYDEELEKAIERLQNAPVIARSDQTGALSDIFAYLASSIAPDETRVVLITPGRILGETEATRTQMAKTGELFGAQNWRVDVMTLPTTGIPARELLSEVSRESGGDYYDLGTGQGIGELLAREIGLEGVVLIDAELRPGTESIASAEIAPHTRSLRVVFVRINSATQVTLFRPNAAPATNEFPNIDVQEMHNTVTYTVSEPTPGEWRLRGVGAGLKLLAYAEIKNPIQLELIPQPPLPIGEPGLITVAAMIEGQPQPLAAARLKATVQQPDGVTQTRELNDRGVAGDEITQDGIFSAAIPAPEAQGVNDVQLELTWDDYDALIRGSGVYHTEHFPKLSLNRSEEPTLTPGDNARVAIVEVTTGGFPHLLEADEMRGMLTGPVDELPVEFVAVEEFDDGLAWQFEVYAAPIESGDYELQVSLDSEHLGRPFNAVLAGPSVSITVIQPTPVPTATPIRKATPTPDTDTVEEDPEGGFPIWTVILPLAIIALLVGTPAAWFLSRTKPYGYVYDDMNRLIVDFNRVERDPKRLLLAKDRVGASELPSLPFNGGEFHFRSDRVELRYTPADGDPSLRVNSRPADSVVTLDEHTWLGVGGRLLHFVTEQPTPETSADSIEDSEEEPTR